MVTSCGKCKGAAEQPPDPPAVVGPRLAPGLELVDAGWALAFPDRCPVKTFNERGYSVGACRMPLVDGCCERHGFIFAD